MKLAFSTIGCPEWSWDEVLSAASDLGYGGIEIRGIGKETYAPAITAFSKEHIGKSLADLRRLGLALTCLTSTAVLGKSDGYEQGMAEAKAYIDLAKNLQVPYVRVMCEDTAAPEITVDEALVAQGLHALADYATGTDVTVLLETNGLYADTKPLAKLFAELPERNLGILWDVHHPYRFAGERPQETIANIGKWVRYVHLKDSVLQNGRVRYRMLGDGDLPLKEFLGSLRTVGYQDWYSLEWVRRWDMALEEPGVAFARFVGAIHELANQ